MIDKHLLHIGMSKTGTTWLWKMINNSLDFKDSIKENDFFNKDIDIHNYIKYYSKYNITANFDPNQCIIDRCLIKKLSKIKTIKCSITFRDPQSFAESWYNTANYSANDYARYLIDTQYFCYDQIVKRWLEFFPNLNILLYDDLVSDSELFYLDYCKWAGITPAESIMSPLNKSRTKQIVNFNKQQKSIINSNINKFENIINKDLSHWIM